jgi:multidrug efflux pump subunit AcrA (membrane-fusion protein)
MTIRKMSAEDIAAETAQVAKLEAALQDAQTTLAACPNPDTYRYPPPAHARMATDAHRNGLVSAVAEAERALKQARITQSNNLIFAEIISGNESLTAKNAAEKAAKEAQQKGENEAEFKRQAENIYCQHGGTMLEFARVWPNLREKLLEEKTMATLRENAGGDLVGEYIRLRNQAHE